MEKLLEKLRSVMEDLEKIKEGAYIRVIWHDASHTSRDSSIAPRFYVTIKESLGAFGGLKIDPKTETPYIIVITERTDGTVSEYDSIPLGCVEKILPLGAEKAPAKVEKRTKKEGGSVKTVWVMQKIAVAE